MRNGSKPSGNGQVSGRLAKVADLTPDTQNANKGTERGGAMIEDSLRRFGAGRSILIDKHGNVIAGNKTLEHAGSIGMEDVIVVQSDGTKIVAVQRMDLDLKTDLMAKELAVADNRSGELSLEWDSEVLAALAQDVDLSGFFTDKELNELGALTGDTPEVPDAKIDQAEELQEKWQTERDQIWSIPSKSAPEREHRIMCGDSTSALDIGVLMAGQRAQMVFTDPPYGVDYDGGTEKREKLEGDHPGTEIYADSLIHLREAADDEASLYLWYADAHAAAAAAAGYQIVAQIIWAKNHAQFVSSAHYHGKHEPCFFAHRKGKTARWFGPNNEVTLWEYDRAPSNDFHPTQKPPVLAFGRKVSLEPRSFSGRTGRPCVVPNPENSRQNHC
jgi:hypothetical protein